MDVNRELCRECNRHEITPCEECEKSEYLEIQLDNDTQPEYKTIFGTNEYANLNTDQRPHDHNPKLAQAWRQSPEKGIAQLILDTSKTIDAFTPELLRHSKELIE